MNLLIPFTDADLYAWIGLFLTQIPYQLHRFKTPFSANSQPLSEGGVSVVVKRRFWFDWPLDARNRYSIKQDSEQNWPMAVEVARVRPNDPDADEKIIEAVVRAKQDAQIWRGPKMDSDTAELYSTAKRALKR